MTPSTPQVVSVSVLFSVINNKGANKRWDYSLLNFNRNYTSNTTTISHTTHPRIPPFPGNSNTQEFLAGAQTFIYNPLVVHLSIQRLTKKRHCYHNSHRSSHLQLFSFHPVHRIHQYNYQYTCPHRKKKKKNCLYH